VSVHRSEAYDTKSAHAVGARARRGPRVFHSTPDGPRYATHKDFVYGEDVTIGDWTISTDCLPRYKNQGSELPSQ
jgi:hypothetical protein